MLYDGRIYYATAGSTEVMTAGRKATEGQYIDRIIGEIAVLERSQLKAYEGWLEDIEMREYFEAWDKHDAAMAVLEGYEGWLAKLEKTETNKGELI